jgi:hypothetical protein
MHSRKKNDMQQPRSRYAVGTFDRIADVGRVMAQLRAHGIPLQRAALMVDKQMLRGASGSARNSVSELTDALECLHFAGKCSGICCTSGPLAHALRARGSGSPNLPAALSPWLVQRHAVRLDEEIRRGRLLLWVELLDAADEVAVCATLLKAGPHPVEVHDLGS